MKITVIWSMASAILMVLLILVQILQKKPNWEENSQSQFECGFNTMNPTHIPFSLQFFLIALLFLIFDVEIALILSYPMEPSSTKNILVILTFILVLTIGLLYEWQKSKINWSK